MCPLLVYVSDLSQKSCFGTRILLQKTVFRERSTFLYVLDKVVLSNWPYGPWDHITISEKKLIVWEKRYQTNPSGGFSTFQVTLQLIKFSVNDE